MTSQPSHNLLIGQDLKRTNYQGQLIETLIVNMCKFTAHDDEKRWCHYQVLISCTYRYQLSYF